MLQRSCLLVHAASVPVSVPLAALVGGGPARMAAGLCPLSGSVFNHSS